MFCISGYNRSSTMNLYSTFSRARYFTIKCGGNVPGYEVSSIVSYEIIYRFEGPSFHESIRANLSTSSFHAAVKIFFLN